MFPASDALHLDHEPEAVRDLASLDGLVGLDAGDAVPVSGAFGLGTVAVGIEFLSHDGGSGTERHYICYRT